MRSAAYFPKNADNFHKIGKENDAGVCYISDMTGGAAIRTGLDVMNYDSRGVVAHVFRFEA